MKKILIYSFIFVLSIFNINEAFSQTDQFKEVYTRAHIVCEYLDKDEWIDSKTIVVFNYNDGSDIMMYKNDGTSELFTVVGGFKEGYTDSGEKYQYTKALGEDGNEVYFQYFNSNGNLRIFIFGSNEDQTLKVEYLK